jgi:hypothetical protein
VGLIFQQGYRVSFSSQCSSWLCGLEFDQSPSSADIRNAWSYTSTPLYVFTIGLIKHSPYLTFYLLSAEFMFLRVFGSRRWR